jgi:hypothetical protein
MNVHLDMRDFIDELEVYAKRKLNYPVEVGELLQIVMQTGLVSEFEGLIFQAKFLVRTQEIMKRIGPGMDGFEKLSTEFQSSVKKSIDFLNVLMERAPSDVARKLTDTFIVMETDSFSRLMKLFSDLSWIKRWQVDGKPLPYETKSAVILDYQDGTKEKELGEKASVPLVRIQKSALSGAILFVLFLFVDPPVTILGWILTLGISAFLMYIVLQIHIMTRTSKS